MDKSQPTSYYVDDKFQEYFECERQEMIAYVPKHTRTVLEVGCGAGAFGRTLKQNRQVEFWGIEPDHSAAQYAERFLDRVLVGLYPDGVELPQGYFDCVVFNDVLEHMIDPWTALKQTHDLLTAQGCVVASVPNIRYLTFLYKLVVRGEWEYIANGLLDKTHLRFFTKKSMIKMFNDTGYEVLHINGIYANPRWQVKALQLILPRFVNETKYIDYAILAKPKGQESDE